MRAAALNQPDTSPTLQMKQAANQALYDAASAEAYSRAPISPPARRHFTVFNWPPDAGAQLVNQDITQPEKCCLCFGEVDHFLRSAQSVELRILQKKKRPRIGGLYHQLDSATSDPLHVGPMRYYPNGTALGRGAATDDARVSRD